MKTNAAVFAYVQLCRAVVAEAEGTKALISQHQSHEDIVQPMAAWLRNRGASVDMHLQGSYREHGGANIRGVISTSSSPPGTVLMTLPKHLWIWEHTSIFADLIGSMEALLMESPSCSAVNGKEVSKMMIAAGMAREKAKGNASDLHLALKALPSLHDYQSFHPRLAGPEILRDFKSLAISGTIRAQQVVDTSLRHCFTELKNKTSSIAGIEWPHVHEALEQIRTRAFGSKDLPGSPVVIPLADLLNTSPAQEHNTLWHLSAENFTMSTAGKVPVAANAELFDSYCAKCNNKDMLLLWGIYLETNSNRGLECSQRSASDKSLHNATMAMLETKKHPTWAAPRCKAAVFEAPQGTMRCSLARLAWEACSSHWAGNMSVKQTVCSDGPECTTRLALGDASSRRNKAVLHSKSRQAKHMASRATREAMLLDQSYRHAVHPALLTMSSQV